MDISPSPSQTGFRSSRRSFPNLQHLSLAPLSSRFPLDNDNIDADFDGLAPPSSYIQSTTAPTTPSILGRSPSQQRRRKNNRRSAYYPHESHIPSSSSSVDSNAPIAKAKSTSALPSHRSTINRTIAEPPTLSSPTQSRHLPKGKSQPSNDEWLYRAGLAIAEESRLAKGQSWLVSRHSSTSLVATKAATEAYPTHREAISTSRLPLLATDESAAIDDSANDDPPTPRWPASLSRPTSRNPSRAQSRAESRRGSRGSRMDMLALSGLVIPQQGREGQEAYFDAALGAGPDFVDAETEAEEEAEEQSERIGDAEEGEDEEVRRLARQRGFGFGGFVDRLVGWTLFNVDEDREESEREDGRAEEPQEAAARRRAEVRRRRELLERTASSSALAARRERAAVAEDEMPADRENQGGWQDAAWLLSVASKVVL